MRKRKYKMSYLYNSATISKLESREKNVSEIPTKYSKTIIKYNISNKLLKNVYSNMIKMLKTDFIKENRRKDGRR